MFVHVKETYVLPFKRIFVKELCAWGEGGWRCITMVPFGSR